MGDGGRLACGCSCVLALCRAVGGKSEGVMEKCRHHKGVGRVEDGKVRASKVRASFSYCPYGSSWLYMGYY